MVFFITLPINITVSTKPEVGHASSAPKKTYIGLKVIITSTVSMVIMLFLLIIKFDLAMFF